MGLISLYRRFIYFLSDLTGIRLLREADDIPSIIKSRQSAKKNDNVNFEYAKRRAEMHAEVADVADGPGMQSANDQGRFKQFLKSYSEMVDSVDNSMPGLTESAEMRALLSNFELRWNALPPAEQKYDQFFQQLQESGDLDRFNNLYAETQVKIGRTH